VPAYLWLKLNLGHYSLLSCTLV